MSIPLKNPKLVITGVDGTGTEDPDQYQHEVFKIILKNGDKVYTLDLSSAQDGYYEPVTPWEEYVEARVASLYPGKCFHYLGEYRNHIEACLDAHDLSNEAASFPSLNLKMYKALKRMTMDWEQKNGTVVAAFLQLKPDNFEKSTEMAGSILKGLQGYIK